jgi:hypothetical protein
MSKSHTTGNRNYRDRPTGKLTRVDDFLPSASELIQEGSIPSFGNSKTYHLKLCIIKATALLLCVVYFREWLTVIISSGDLRPSTLILGLVLAIICNFGLWLAAGPGNRNRKWPGLLALVPTFLLSPIIVASYHAILSVLVLVVASVAAINLVQSRNV